MSYESILLDISDDVATITINRPQALNALTIGVLREIDGALDAAIEQGARALLLTGAGRGFSSGADLMGMGQASGASGGGKAPSRSSFDAGRGLEQNFNPLLERLYALPMPIVCAVNGPAAGAGCSLALAGDIVIAARSAYFLQAFVNIGLVPDVGSTWLLPRLAGKANATAMMMLGERIPAEKALEWGLIYQLADDDQLMAEATALALRLAKGPTRTYALIRQGIRASLDASLTEALRVERNNQREAGRTADFAEGVAAFLQKRPANFSGK